MKKSSLTVFIDTSAWKALFDPKDDFHTQAAAFWKKVREEKFSLITSNFILDETFTLLKSQMGKEAALLFRQDLLESTESIRIVRVMAKDEKEAWEYFEKLPGRGVSFTDSTSFSVMKRLDLDTAFTFDRDFSTAGFQIVPKQ